jgi:membrane protein required for colicin V production
MNELPLTLFDVIVLVVVGLSALAALTRGAVAEILGLASWAGAAVIAFAALPWAGPMVRAAVASDPIADLLAVAGVFLVALVMLKLVTGTVSRAVAGSALGPIDKLLGLVFGALRGAVVVAAAYLVASHLLKPEMQPDWIRQAYLIEPVRAGSAMLERLVPEAYRREGIAAAGVAVDAAQGVLQDATGAAPAGQGYTPEQRQALEKLLPPQR